MLRRLHHEQPEGFAFTQHNQAWAEAQITKYPEGRQASAIIPLLWRAQEQEGWLTRPAIEHVARMLDMAYIRALEVATFYFMFQLQPVGSVAHIQVCGTTSCMICGAEDLMAVCKEKIAAKPHELSADGKFSWEEVECLGACANAPMAQIGKDYYEDLTTERMAEIIDELAAGKVPVPGPQNGRYASEPLSGLSSLKDHESGRTQYNASAHLATEIGDTVKRIDGSEVPLVTPWREEPATGGQTAGEGERQKQQEPKPSEDETVDATGATKQEAEAEEIGRPEARGDKQTLGNTEGPKNPAPAPGGTSDEDEEAIDSGPKGGAGTEPGSGMSVPSEDRDGNADMTSPGSAGGARVADETATATGESDETAAGVARAADLGAPTDERPAIDTENAESGGTPSAYTGGDSTGDKAGGETGNDAGVRPATLDAPREGGADNLQHIRGIGPKLEGMLNEMGYYHFDQIAAWTPAEVAWADQHLVGFKGRVSRDGWVGQARKLASGEETDFSTRAKKDDMNE